MRCLVDCFAGVNWGVVLLLSFVAVIGHVVFPMADFLLHLLLPLPAGLLWVAGAAHCVWCYFACLSGTLSTRAHLEPWLGSWICVAGCCYASLVQFLVFLWIPCLSFSLLVMEVGAQKEH